MKKIEAIIRLTQFDKVRDALAQIGVEFFTLQEVKGYGLQKGEKFVYRGSVFGSDYIARLQLDIFATNEKSELIIETIMASAKTGDVGDGKIVSFDLDQVFRIRNGESGSKAL
jgi:nitrogen regulatory protein PII